uniref:Superoxide dismutase copper/zinc binding domain-containing protein n=1 Tax=Sinocyclocheilus grahami TaxID=75366 RepID=A0A672QCS8_SINGR
MFSAVVNMQGIKGYFSFHQPSPFDLTTITVNLTNLDRRVGPYHVHQFPLPQMRSPSDSSCSNNNLGGHWNPFNVNTQAPAYPPPRGSTHDLFEVGDLSARHGSLENTNNFQATFMDWNLPLFGRNSIVGRSVVIHMPNSTRFACASISYPGEVTVAKAQLSCGLGVACGRTIHMVYSDE